MPLANSPRYDGNYGISCAFPCRGTLYAPDAHGVQWCDSIQPDTKHAWKKSPDGAWLLVGIERYDATAGEYRTQPINEEETIHAN